MITVMMVMMIHNDMDDNNDDNCDLITYLSKLNTQLWWLVIAAYKQL